MMKRVVLSIFVILFTFNANAQSTGLSNFSHPFLLGEWYMANPNPESSAQDFIAMRVHFDSNYHYTIDIQRRDYSVDHWEGTYNASDDSIIIGLDTDTPQVYAYSTTHNALNLNGVQFVKGLSQPLAGIWSSDVVTGSDILASKVSKVDLILQRDFIFMLRSSGDEGRQSVKSGIYFVEDGQIVLLYEDGETHSRYSLQGDLLTISGQEADMYAELSRVK